MSEKNSSRTLIGLKSILKYLEMSEPTFKEFVRMGLPARVHRRYWYAHKDNIDDFFRHFTRHHQKDDPMDAE